MPHSSHAKRTVGFIGLGVMGSSMAQHLLDAGCRLRVHTRTAARAQAFLDQGAVWCATPSQTAQGSEAVISIVGFPADVEEIYLGENGILAQAAPDTLLIDMTTSSPTLARRIAEEAASRHCHALDAPVSGGDIGAREARLSIMAGGTVEAFERAYPLLQLMGSNIVRQGPAGSGQHTKMANQIAIAAVMLGVCESMAYASRAGLDPAAVLRSISGGAAGSWSLSNLAPRILAGDFAPGFYVKHFLKDMRIALDSAAELGLETPGLALAYQMYERLSQFPGGAELGTQGLYHLYAKQPAAPDPAASSEK
ncbi:MAG TPA: NAD(P)-dependent oxidoreductase [Verrucomicrobiales bacterium]|nr:NAD(P)-dependent oxidoreductase [Verrucomicrobiales bacterium]